MKPKFFSITILPIAAFILTLSIFFCGCKKDQLTINEEKRFAEVGFKPDPSNPYDGGWGVTLKPDGVVDIAPGGDIIYRGTYKISGKNLKISTDQMKFNFEILSDTEIKEKQYGTILRLIP